MIDLHHVRDATLLARRIRTLWFGRCARISGRDREIHVDTRYRAHNACQRLQRAINRPFSTMHSTVRRNTSSAKTPLPLNATLEIVTAAGAEGHFPERVSTSGDREDGL
jgi:hypothetical protein